MEVTIKISERLALEARAHGVSVVYVQEILAQRAADGTSEQGIQSASATIDQIIELRKENKLGGLRTKDFIHEGHKY